MVKYTCLYCYKYYSKRVDEEFKKWFKNTFMFSNNDVNKFIVLLTKGFYPHECIDEWEKFNGETSLSEKELFCSLR